MPFQLPTTPASPAASLARLQRLAADKLAADRLRASERNFASLRTPGAFNYA
jgi:hypothetical protein